jgi:2-oxo-4-hydroxy-4-carboxy--5-ureidoimidazoline (OHCU) decarboxylase
MPAVRLIRAFALAFPSLHSAPWLHELGLGAFKARDFASADALFERAAEACRRDLEIHRLARVRAHQLMARAVSGDATAAECADEAGRLLDRLDWIEDLDAPFRPVEGSRLAATWESRLAARGDTAPQRSAALPALSNAA